MKALIPAAGLGTRYLPLTKAVPKELIPVRGLPVLHHVVAEAKAAGCSEIGIVLSAGKGAIREYFSWNAELMDWLDRTGKRSAMAAWEALMDGLSFTWIDQPEQRGLGDAVLCGRDFVAGDPVCVLLGDTSMEGGSPLPEMVARFRGDSVSVVAVEPVPPERATRYGVCGGVSRGDGGFDLDTMIEKPALGEMPLMREAGGAALAGVFAFAARYLLSPALFPALERTGKGRNGEVQLTDAMAAVLREEGFAAVRLPGRRVDVGAPDLQQKV
jgi:UTP--glucose-1-phosphate uridylyltransferase